MERARVFVRIRWSSVILGTVVTLLAVSLLTACGANGTATDASSHPSGVFFPQVREGLDGGPTALAGEKLVLDDKGCLRVDPGRGRAWVPVWPADLELETGSGKTRVTDGKDRTVAEVGKEVSMGGGQIGLPKDVVSPRTARGLRNRCPGDIGNYWIALDPSMEMVVPQGSVPQE